MKNTSPIASNREGKIADKMVFKATQVPNARSIFAKINKIIYSQLSVLSFSTQHGDELVFSSVFLLPLLVDVVRRDTHKMCPSFACVIVEDCSKLSDNVCAMRRRKEEKFIGKNKYRVRSSVVCVCSALRCTKQTRTSSPKREENTKNDGVIMCLYLNVSWKKLLAWQRTLIRDR